MPAEPLTNPERSRLGDLVSSVDCHRVRLYKRGGGVAGLMRKLVLGASRNRAIALGNHVFLPDRCRHDLAVLAHELTHCRQYQRWGPVRYYLRGAKEQIQYLIHRCTGLGSNPYSYRVEPGKAFESYGMEQQAQMVEDWFRATAPADPEACPPRAPERFHRDRPPSP